MTRRDFDKMKREIDENQSTSQSENSKEVMQDRALRSALRTDVSLGCLAASVCLDGETFLMLLRTSESSGVSLPSVRCGDAAPMLAAQ